MNKYKIEQSSQGCKVVKEYEDGDKHYLVSVYNGSCEWTKDCLYGKSYSILVAQKHVKNLQQEEWKREAKVIRSENDLYSKLLDISYSIYEYKNNGMVCGSGAEEIRDKIFNAIKETGII